MTIITNHPAVRENHGSTNEKAAPATTGTTSVNHSISESHSTTSAHLREVDPFLGWYALAAGVKQSRTRPMKKSWIRKGGK
jgi:hypothetical protein